jgi:hypothetical protein
MLDFKGHRFAQDMILTGVRGSLAYPLSDRNLEARSARVGGWMKRPSKAKARGSPLTALSIKRARPSTSC